MSMKQNVTGAVDEGSCRPSVTTGEKLRLPTRCLRRPGLLDAAAPPELRCADWVGSCLRWKVSRDRCVAWRLANSFRTPNRILGEMNVRGFTAQPRHAGDANAVTTMLGSGNSVTFAERPGVVERAPLMAGRWAA